MKKAAIIFSVVLLAACGSTKLLTPTQTDAQRGAQTYPGYTLAQLNEGKSLFETKCTQCHGLKSPMKKGPDKWPGTVERMVKKASKSETKKISASEQESITKYLVTMSSASK